MKLAPAGATRRAGASCVQLQVASLPLPSVPITWPSRSGIAPRVEVARLEGYVYRRDAREPRADSGRGRGNRDGAGRLSTSRGSSWSARRCCRRIGASASITRPGRDGARGDDSAAAPARRDGGGAPRSPARPGRRRCRRGARAGGGLRRDPGRARGALAGVPRQPRLLRSGPRACACPRRVRFPAAAARTPSARGAAWTATRCASTWVGCACSISGTATTRPRWTRASTQRRDGDAVARRPS